MTDQKLLDLMNQLTPRGIVVVEHEDFPGRWFWYFLDGKLAGYINVRSGGWEACKGAGSAEGQHATLGVWLTKELADQALRDAIRFVE
jgi:hypothetical protein